jgi:hypothetical protein
VRIFVQCKEDGVLHRPRMGKEKQNTGAVLDQSMEAGRGGRVRTVEFWAAGLRGTVLTTLSKNSSGACESSDDSWEF